MTIPRILSACISMFLSLSATQAQNDIPRLERTGNVSQLIVEGNPFLIRGGELGNSSATTLEYMFPIWPKLRTLNLNTILVPIYWELVEPQDGNFDFSLYQQLINEARENKLHIIFLWFGSWKNSMSSHAPAWVKINQKKYPRAEDDQHHGQEILTPFSDNNRDADLEAFVQLMKFIRDFDSKQQTVIMIQVENEIGMLPSARDYSPMAEKAFRQDVPAELIRYLMDKKANLLPEITELWGKNGYKTSGNWEAVFGKSLRTDELFMAWYFGRYTNAIAEAGKKAYPLPMYVNAALNRPGKEPGSGYPSAGPLPHLMDVWKAAAPAIDLFVPDIYFPDFRHWNDLYTRQNDPLFIPEHRFDNTVAAKALFAYGHYHALGFSPFSIESTNNPEEEPIGKVYQLIDQLSPLLLDKVNMEKTEGVLLSKEKPDTVLRMGDYLLTCRHEYTLGWSEGAKGEEWPLAGAIIIPISKDACYFAGTGVVITCSSVKDENIRVGILKAEEGFFEKGEWKIMRHLNGDQTHQGRHLRIQCREYSIQRFELYTYR